MPSTPPSAYQVTTPNRTPRPSTTQQPSYYKPTTPFRAAPPPPPSVTTQPVSYYKPTTPIKIAPPPSVSSLSPTAKFFLKVPTGGGAALAIALELLFPPPAGDNYYDRNPKNPPSKYKLHPPEPKQELEKPIPPFFGGIGNFTRYITRYYNSVYQGTPGNYSINQTEFGTGQASHFGPILSVRKVAIPFSNPPYDWKTDFYVTSTKPINQGPVEQYDATLYTIGPYKEPPVFFPHEQQYAAAAPDPGTNPPSPPPTYSSPGNPLGAPIAAPPSSAPSPLPRAPGIAPSGDPGGQPKRFPGGLPSGDPGGQPKRFPGGFPSPSPPPTPGPTPQPNKYPDPAPEGSPNPAPNGDPGTSPGPGVGPLDKSAPTPNPAPTSPPWGNRSPAPADPTKYPETGFQPNVFRANPLIAKPAFAPNPLEPKEFAPNPNTGDPEPKAPPLVTPNRSPDPPKDPNDDLGDKIRLGTGIITTILAGITALVQPGALTSAANAGICQAFAPGGCAAPVGNNAAAAATNSANNGTALASIMAFLQGIQTLFLIPIKAGVELVNTKLGPLMSGLNGIGGFLARTAEAAKLDKVLNAMNTVLLLHNAAMLSRNLGSTLGDLTSQALATIGISDGDSPIDVNETLGKQANNFMSTVLGAEVWAGTKTSWNKASSIIASATNLMYTVRSMFDSTREILEWTAENTGKIGNALKRFRIVGENAYKWLPERVTVQNRFTQRLDKIREGTDQLDDAASSLSGVLGEVQSIQSEYADLQEQKQKFDKNISELTPKTREENKPVTDAVTNAKDVSKAPTGIENVFRGEGSTTDERTR